MPSFVKLIMTFFHFLQLLDFLVLGLGLVNTCWGCDFQKKRLCDIRHVSVIVVHNFLELFIFKKW
jgi:hypothetical protein